MLWYRRSLHAFLAAFGLAVGGLILSDLGTAALVRHPDSPWRVLIYLGYTGFAAAVAASFYSLYAGVRAWTSARQICWWVAVPLLLVAGLLYQLGQFTR